MNNSHFYYNYPNILFSYDRLYCEPITIAATAAAAAGGMQMYGQYQEGKATAQMYNYQAALNYQEAATRRKYAEEQKKAINEAAVANITLEQTAAGLESARLMRDVSQLTGKQKAAIGALGIGGVTAEDIAIDTFDKARLDQLAIRYNANVQSWQIREQAKRDIWTLGEEVKQKTWALESEAGQYRVAGKQARRAANIKMGATLLETAASVANIAGMSKTGTTTTTTRGATPGGGSYQFQGGYRFRW